jgi:hypothetical protein
MSHTGLAPFQPGDLVEYLPTGERWNVDDYDPGTDYSPASILLGRSSGGEGVARGEVLDADPRRVRLIRRLAERSLSMQKIDGMLITTDAKTGEVIMVEPLSAARPGPAQPAGSDPRSARACPRRPAAAADAEAGS